MEKELQNDLSAASITSEEDNTWVENNDEQMKLNSDSWKKVRHNLEKVRQDIESNIYSTPNHISPHRRQQPVENTDDTSITHEHEEPGSWPSFTKDETVLKQPHRESGNKEGNEQVYSRHIQCGDRNFMLICEPKNRPQSKNVMYRQDGNRNIMLNLRVSSNVYQLVQKVKHSRTMQVIPLDSEGEVWLEIKRRSQVNFTKRGSSPVGTQSVRTATTSLASSESDNLHYNIDDLVPRRHIDQHSDPADDYDYNTEDGGRSVEEQSYDFDSGANDEWANGSHYEILSMKVDKDRLRMRFSKPRDGKLEDLERAVLSHQNVWNFLRDSSNDFEASLCDWMYQSDESIYSYITGRQFDGTGVAEVDLIDDIIEPVSESPSPAVNVKTGKMWTQEETEPLYHEWKQDIAVPPYQRAKRPPSYEPSSPTGPPLPPRNGANARRPPPAHPFDKQAPPVPVSLPSHPRSDDSGFQTTSHASKRGALEKPLSLKSIRDCEWYHGKLDKAKAKALLENKPPGSFLVRDSTSNTAEQDGSMHTFTLEFVDEKTRIKKLMIMRTGNLYHFKEFGKQAFGNVPDLVAKVLTSGLEIKDSRTDTWTIFQVQPVGRNK